MVTTITNTPIRLPMYKPASKLAHLARVPSEYSCRQSVLVSRSRRDLAAKFGRRTGRAVNLPGARREEVVRIFLPFRPALTLTATAYILRT